MLSSHPDRVFINEELHLRRMPEVQAPAHVFQILRLISNDERLAEEQFLAKLPVRHTKRQSSVRHAEFLLYDGRILLWERHSEASTITLISHVAEPALNDGAKSEMVAWMESGPGSVLRATRISIVTDDEAADAIRPHAGFDPEELLSADLGGEARIWSDFKLRDDGYGCLIISVRGMRPGDIGRLVQRLQELGNYRNLALLGLRVAQQKSHELGNLENALLMATGIGDSQLEKQILLDRLIALAGEANQLSAKTGYRMSATAAYTEIAIQRLAALNAKPIAGFQSLEDFIERRLLPGARTCEAFDRRLERLSGRIERSTAQLRTQVELDIQRQNSAMLASMERSSIQQLHLQRMVEGLSVVALSYYSVGLISYAAKAISHHWPRFDSETAAGWATLPVIAAVALFIRSRTRRPS